MAIRVSEIRNMSAEERNSKLKGLRDELMHERGVSAMGGAPTNPGAIRSIKKGIARILTVQREEDEI
ncbi:MAG: 50S ribosomal protein L29 [Candidatus Methanomethylophilaceae archaeon]|jgi:large subunit ribosomal protein L29|nr:50S ribosomal protein L29 [Methanomassiliicoccales archaeon RumEn M2]MDD2532737.1 50S ribosomal protein L29 [Candidatus Methanomethylophilaceae archaeon]MDI9378422.1 50S ribosomal protein L29 [Candidatus Thermoplasmatota archaeon]MDD2779297.1 50S ribosomal protein L29 [Candidatus Methanomethylophilaceae archaeon]MDD4119884.1 50S ribosomal protein L29 [Candidatus Methanomethylophilaceae archaeon]